MPQPSLKKVVKQLTYQPKERVELFLSLELNMQAKALHRLSNYVKKQLLPKVKNDDLLPILNKLDPDEATDILQLLPASRQKKLVGTMSEDLRSKISLLLQFDPKTAAGLMSLNYVTVEANQRLADVAAEVDYHEKVTGKVPEVLVIEGNQLQGYIPLQKLISTHPTDKVDAVKKRVWTVRHTASTRKVISTFLDHPHQKLVVLGENDSVLGIIYSDDVIRVLQEQEISSLYDFAGLSEEESIYDSVMQKVRHRYKWLIINLGTAFLAAYAVSLFEDTLAKFVLLAAYMPIVAGMGGNAGTQALAVLVRAISQGQIELSNAWPAIKKEVGAGLVNGIIIGVIVFLIVAIWNRDIEIALVLGIALIINMIIAGYFGALVPLIMKKIGKDPAASATIFITTATDVLGFLAFLGLAALMLN